MAGKADRPLILASGSRARREMMQAAGLRFEVIPADVDEATLREALLGDTEVEPEDVAELLASAKAEAVSRNNPEALVIGADQVLALGSEIINKSADFDEARATLLKLRGVRHELHSAVAVAVGGEVVWTDIDSATLVMRKFSNEFLTGYLARAGGEVLQSVGCYQIEGFGVQLFERIDGNHFTILGMPLLALLAELRKRVVIAS